MYQKLIRNNGGIDSNYFMFRGGDLNIKEKCNEN